jgi:hypothetical protein
VTRGRFQKGQNKQRLFEQAVICRSSLPGGHEGEPEYGGTVTDSTQVVEGSLDRIHSVH